SSNKEIEYCGDLKSSLKHYEKIIIKSALDKNNGHRGKTAEFLKVTRRTLERKMIDLDLR
ncbi:MAG: helix-turn-helix domain-containing protein, partial [Desulfobacteraceae bacterium]